MMLTQGSLDLGCDLEGSPEQAVDQVIEQGSASNLKRTWVQNGLAQDWDKVDAKTFLMHATEIKNIWVPYGE